MPSGMHPALQPLTWTLPPFTEERGRRLGTDRQALARKPGHQQLHQAEVKLPGPPAGPVPQAGIGVAVGQASRNARQPGQGQDHPAELMDVTVHGVVVAAPEDLQGAAGERQRRLRRRTAPHRDAQLLQLLIISAHLVGEQQQFVVNVQRIVAAAAPASARSRCRPGSSRSAHAPPAPGGHSAQQNRPWSEERSYQILEKG